MGTDIFISSFRGSLICTEQHWGNQQQRRIIWVNLSHNSTNSKYDNKD